MSDQPTRKEEIIDPTLLGKLLEAVPPQSPPPGLRAKVLARALGPSVLADLGTESNDAAKREFGRGDGPRASVTRTAPEKAIKNLIHAISNTPENMTPFEIYVDKFMALFDLDAQRTRDILKKAAATSSDDFIASGIPNTQLFYFKGGPRVADATCGIVRVAAGAIFPAHEHQGDERVIVLQGSATEQSGRRLLTGDAIHCKKGTRHSFRAEDSGPLIFAVVLEKPNKWLLGQIILDFLFRKRRFVGRN